jgi:molybdopterin synthase catalytic subunit
MYLSTDAIDLGLLVAEVTAPQYGGIACFLGTVRNHHSGREVARLEYSAYGPMAEAECNRIVQEARARWDCAVALRHRIGMLEIGDSAVAIAVAAAHREAAFAACRFVIEELKRRVPIWKRERFADGTVEWVDPTQVSGYAGKTVSEEAGKVSVEASSSAGPIERKRK